MSKTQPDGLMLRRGSGLPVVVIHGNGVDHRILLNLDPALEAVGGLERIYLDLPGFGETPALAEPGGLPEIADWLVGRITDLLADQPFAVLGNSLGGLLARHVRRSLPDQVVGMALLAPVVNPDADQRCLPSFEVAVKDEELLQSLSEEDRHLFTEMAAQQTPAVWKLFSQFALPGIRSGDTEAFDRLGERYFLTDNPDAGALEFQGPVLVVTGRQDHIVGWQDQYQLVTRSYPSASFAVLEGTGHNVHLDQAEVCASLVTMWAQQLPR